jgi:hypothetical protein
MACTGLGIGEALGLRWCDADLDAGLLRVRLQLSRCRELKKPKTRSSQRDVILGSGTVDLLRRRRADAAHAAPTDYIFGTATGTAMDYRHVGRAFGLAVQRADCTGRADCRCTRCATATPTPTSPSPSTRTCSNKPTTSPPPAMPSTRQTGPSNSQRTRAAAQTPLQALQQPPPTRNGWKRQW